MKRTISLLGLVAAGAATVLAVAGLSSAAGKAAPTNQSPPTISGTPQEGETLTAHNGNWNGTTPITYSYMWRRCDQNGGSCANISGSNGSTYVLKKVDVDNTLRVRVTAKNSDGSASSVSVPTAVIKAAPAPPPTTSNGCPTSGSGTLAISSVSAPARLTVDGQSASPAPVTRGATSVTLRFHVSACNGRSVQGASVYATAVPFNQFSIPPEATTGSDGWAELTMQRQAGFPATPRQGLLTVFVRARKQGDNVLGGISTRRLVSFPVQLNG
jgi:hypothetical protein